MFDMFYESLKSLLGFLFAIFIGFLFAFVLREFILFNAIVPSESMHPTVSVNDLLIGNRLAYSKELPKRGDIITFENPDVSDEICLKRIIGLPGETLEIVDGKVFIDNSSEPLDEPYLGSEIVPEGDFGPYEVPEGSYFVMGDNRNVSYDSRYWKNHFISFDKISSKIIFKYYPKFETMD